jgi:HK97 family phage portal protein
MAQRPFWQRVKAFFAGNAPKSAGGMLSGILMSGQAPRRGTRELLAAYRTLPYLHSVVHRIAYDVASVPFRLYRQRKGSSLKRATGTVRKSLIDGAVRAGKLEEVEEHPVLDVLNTWNPALGPVASRAVCQMHLDLKGETFPIKERNGSGQTLELWPIPPHWIAEVPSANLHGFRASWAGWQRIFPEEDVLWIRQPDPENPYGRGVGAGEALSDETDIGELATKYVKDFYFNGGVPPFILGIKEAGDEQLARFRERLIQEHRGVGKQHHPLVTNGEVSVQELNASLKDQELNELRQLERDVVLQVFNVPPECLGILENSNRSTIDASEYKYATGVLCPRLDLMVSALQSVVDEYGEGLVLDYVSPVPEDREFKGRAMVALPTNYTVDEHRALAGFPPLKDGVGDELYQPAAASPFGGLGFGGGVGEEEPEPPEEELEEDEEEEPKKAVRVAKDVDMQKLERALNKLRPERLTEELDPTWREQMRKWGQRALDELGIDASFDIRNPLIAEHLEQFGGKKIAGLVNEATRRELMEALREGVYAGEGIRDLQKRVVDTFEFASKVRARRIARTEVIGSSNFANLQAFRLSGVVAEKEWLAVRDGNTRDTHKALDGNRARIDQPFSTGTNMAQHPGGFGVPEEDINCRCAVLPVVDAPKSAGSFVHKGMSEAEKVAVWKVFDRRLLSWEGVAASAIRRGFRKQEADILDALEEEL